MTELHPDPIGDSGQKVFQYVQLLAMAAEAVAVIAAARARAAAERNEQKAEAINTGVAVNHKAAADLWAPVLADRKRDSLDVAQTLTAWSAAQAWRADDPEAQRAAVVAEERLHELRPVAMMRYDDLRTQGLDPVAAMRNVVPLLDTNPRIGETSTTSLALPVTANATRLLDEERDVHAGRFSDTAATRVPADDSDAEHDRHRAPHLSGSDLTYGDDNRMTDGPHLGRDGRDLDGPNQDHVAAIGNPAAGTDDLGGGTPSGSPPAASASASVVAPVDTLDAAALLVAESALLTQIQQHRLTAAHEDRMASAGNDVFASLASTSDDLATRLLDEHHDRVSTAQPPVALATDAGDHAHVERDAAQALAASYPKATRQVATASAAAASASKRATATRSAAPTPSMVRR